MGDCTIGVMEFFWEDGRNRVDGGLFIWGESEKLNATSCPAIISILASRWAVFPKN